jgi:adenylosuccinate synthase
LIEYHNFVLTQYFKRDAVPYQQTLDGALALAPALLPMVGDVAALLQDARRRGDSLLFEGAQGALLDIDHGTYPYVTSSNCLAGAAAPGTGIGPQMLDYVLGIVKAYTTRVGTGPFPTELTDEIGAGLAKRGNEFGSVTGRPRRCGWLDVAALKRSLQLNGVDGLCITKLDVLDGMPSIRICTGYRVNGVAQPLLPIGADAVAECKPVYEDMPGWKESTLGVDSFDALPAPARAYLRRIEQLTEVPIAMVSTGAERDETILLHHPFH